MSTATTRAANWQAHFFSFWTGQAVSLADSFGVNTWFVVAGTVGVLMGVAGFFIPALVHLEDQAVARSVGTAAMAAPVYAPGETA